jgi:hypothetical protein
MSGIKSRRWVSGLNRLGLLAFCAFTLQLVVPTAPRAPGTLDFADFALKSGLVDLVRPGQTIDLCSHSDPSTPHQTTHNNCPLCLLPGIPPTNAELLQAIRVFHHSFEQGSTDRAPTQQAWPANPATGPPARLSA